MVDSFLFLVFWLLGFWFAGFLGMGFCFYSSGGFSCFFHLIPINSSLIKVLWGNCVVHVQSHAVIVILFCSPRLRDVLFFFQHILPCCSTVHSTTANTPGQTATSTTLLISIPRPKSKRHLCMRFEDDAALISHTEDFLQQLVIRLTHACKEFGPTVSLKNNS